jgi:hypothetical protein
MKRVLLEHMEATLWLAVRCRVVACVLPEQWEGALWWVVRCRVVACVLVKEVVAGRELVQEVAGG